MSKSENISVIDEGLRDWEESPRSAEVNLAGCLREKLSDTVEPLDLGKDYHLTNTHGMGFGKDQVQGTNYQVDDEVYTLTDADLVYGHSKKRFSFQPVQIKTPAITEAIRSQRDENDAIRWAREERAEALSGPDATLKEIYRRHLDYTKGHVQPIIRSEGTFFPVGENDWFTFYLGLVDGQKKLYVVSKEPSDDDGKLIDVEAFGYTGDQDELEEYPRRRVERSEDKAARHYCSIGSMWSDSVSGDLYCLNHVEYMVNADGAVIRKEDYEHPEVVTDPAVLISIKAQIQEDIEIRAARRVLATEKSQQDSKLKEVLLAHLEYTGGHVSSHIEEGITFYQVGRNASHEFYLGVKDGKYYRLSCGEGGWNDEEDMPTFEKHISELDSDNWGYVGHF